MSVASTALPTVVLPGTSQEYTAFGDRLRFLLTGRETSGELVMFMEETGPGGGPPPHYHANEDEWFYPLEGRVEFLQDGQWNEVPMGTVVFLPKGTIHTFRNCGDGPLRMLVHCRPAGFENFFIRCAAEFDKSAEPDVAVLMQICEEHGIHFVMP
jgi:quercetin dioxygenase-like cupin family protein